MPPHAKPIAVPAFTPRLPGVVVLLVLLVALHTLHAFGIRITDALPIYLVALVYSAFVDRSTGQVATLVFALGHAVLFAAGSSWPLRYTAADAAQVAITALVAPVALLAARRLRTMHEPPPSSGRPSRPGGHTADVAGDGAHRLEAEAHLLSQVSDAVVGTDPVLAITYWSRGAERLFGPSAEEAQGRPLVDACSLRWIHPEDEAIAVRQLESVGAWRGEVMAVAADGRTIAIETVMSAMTDLKGLPCGYIAALRDVTTRKAAETELILAQQQNALQMQRIQEIFGELEEQRRQLQEANGQLARLATTDGLTGVHNHRAFDERVELEFQRAVRYDMPLSLIILDVDHFKQYNDTYGHPAGDEALQAIGAVLREAARATDFVARYGGEEFVLLLPETDRDHSLAAAERLRRALERSNWLKRPITASFGVSSRTAVMESPRRLMVEADTALYASKQAGRNRVTHFGDIAHQSDEDADSAP